MYTFKNVSEGQLSLPKIFEVRGTIQAGEVFEVGEASLSTELMELYRAGKIEFLGNDFGAMYVFYSTMLDAALEVLFNLLRKGKGAKAVNLEDVQLVLDGIYEVPGALQARKALFGNEAVEFAYLDELQEIASDAVNLFKMIVFEEDSYPTFFSYGEALQQILSIRDRIF